jgi:hypothetical protein
MSEVAPFESIPSAFFDRAEVSQFWEFHVIGCLGTLGVNSVTSVAEKLGSMKEKIQVGLITFGAIIVVGLPIVLGIAWLVLWMGNR